MSRKHCGKRKNCFVHAYMHVHTSKVDLKLLVTSNFFFSHSVLKRLVSLGRQKVSLCGNGLIKYHTINVHERCKDLESYICTVITRLFTTQQNLRLTQNESDCTRLYFLFFPTMPFSSKWVKTWD